MIISFFRSYFTSLRMHVAAAIGGAALAGVATSAISSHAASSAADTQAQAAENASDATQATAAQTRNDLLPYMKLGTDNIAGVQSSLKNPALTTSFAAPTQAQAAATPGYQFTLNNGLKAVQNSASARGLGVSGAAQKGAASYATGLADSTYNDTYNRALSTYNTNQTTATNQYNKLLGLVGVGENAAAQVGNNATQATASSNNELTSGAAASAAGTVGSANAINSGVSGATNSALTYALLNKTNPSLFAS